MAFMYINYQLFYLHNTKVVTGVIGVNWADSSPEFSFLGVWESNRCG